MNAVMLWVVWWVQSKRFAFPNTSLAGSGSYHGGWSKAGRKNPSYGWLGGRTDFSQAHNN